MQLVDFFVCSWKDKTSGSLDVTKGVQNLLGFSKNIIHKNAYLFMLN